MPSIATRGSISAKGFGFGSSSSFASNNFLGWLSKNTTYTTYDYGYGIAVDNKGGVYVTGYVYSNSQSAPVILSSKFDALGTTVWEKMIGKTTGSNHEGFGITVDVNGNTYIVGCANYSLSPYPALLIKIDSFGATQWQKEFKATIGTNASILYCTTINSAGNICISGVSSGDDIAIASVTSSGTVSWQRKLSTGYTNAGTGIVTDSSNNIYVAGYGTASGTTQFAYLVKYNSSGTIQWQRYLIASSSSVELFNGVTIDSSGNIYCVGSSKYGTATYSTMLVKYNSSGTLIWQRKLSGSGNTYGQGISIDSSGNLYITGYTISGAFNLGFIAKYNSSGSILWQRTISNNNNANLYSIAVDKKGNIFVSGIAVFTGALGAATTINSFPSDGSKTGTYTNNGQIFYYAVGSLTDSTSTLIPNTGVHTDAAGTLAVTDATLDNVSNLKTLNAVIL